MKFRRRIYSKQSGFGLLISLLLVTLLAGLASNSFRRSQNYLFVVRSQAQHLQALNLAKAGINIARAGLLMDNNDTDDLEEDWHKLSLASQVSPIPIGNGMVSLVIEDEERRQNINALNEQELKDWFKNLKLKRVKKGDILDVDIIEENIHEELADNFLDWTDHDDEIRHNGAESRWYKKQDEEYFPHNRRLATIGELMWVRGFTSDMLFGKKGNPKLKDMITVYGGGKLNVNTVNRDVLITLLRQEDEYMAETVAQAVIDERPYKTEDQAKNVLSQYGFGGVLDKKIKVKSEYFRIIATGIVGNVESRVEAIVKRFKKTCDILLWKETSIENEMHSSKDKQQEGEY